MASPEGKSLMQVKSEAKGKSKRLLAAIVSLPVLGTGIGLIYFGYSETDYMYLFFYFLLGLVCTLFGFYLMLSGFPSGKAKKVVPIPEVREEDTAEKPKAEPAKCPNCGAPILSAGKFCGSCGKRLS